jgi:crotonobetainyl-CoA:carnitine CoA-transferase CaiB-like acyl-CoA transferase
MRPFRPDTSCPLDGLRVLDLSRLVAGNMLSLQLADFGAEVIKIEDPRKGDPLRDWRVKDVSVHWKVYARNKKSVTLNLRAPEGLDLLRKLAATANVFIENFRPGTLEEMGIGPDALHAINPKLILVRVSGWGQDGPYRDKPGFGSLVEGMSTFAAKNGFADRPPVLPPLALADMIAGLYGANAVLVALRAIEHGGTGQVIDLPLLDPMFVVLGPQAANFRLNGKVKPRTGSRSTNAAPRNAYRTKDGLYVCLSASTQKMAERVLRSIGRDDLNHDPRYKTNAARVRHAEELDAIIGAFVGERTQAENVAFFEKAEVTIGPIYDVRQILQDPHILERELVADYPDAEMGQFPMHHVVPRLSDTPASIRTPAPSIGQHNRALLRELGIDEAAYARLLAEGAATEGGAPEPDDE